MSNTNPMTKTKMIKRSISLPEELAEEIKKYSEQQKRSFSAQIALWAEEKLHEIKSKNHA